MPRLYLANLTKQKHDFLYMVPELGTKKMQSIPPGGQIIVYRDDTSEILGGILEQHAQYGLVAYDAIDRSRVFVGLCYRFDKPIDVERIRRAIEKNDDVLETRGFDIRKTTAEQVTRAVAAATDNQVLITEIETEAVVSRGEIGGREGFEIMHQGAPSSDPPASRGRGGRRRAA